MKRTVAVQYETTDGQKFNSRDEAIEHEVTVVLGKVIGVDVAKKLNSDMKTASIVLEALQANTKLREFRKGEREKAKVEREKALAAKKAKEVAKKQKAAKK